MIGFLGVPELYDDEFDPEHHFLVGGGDESSHLIREASLKINPYSPMLDASFQDFHVFDSPEAVEDIDLLLGDTSLEWNMPTLYLGAQLVSPVLSRPLAQAYDLEALPPANSIWYVGSRSYDRLERDWARKNQRLLPIMDVELEVGLRTAMLEIGNVPFRLMINVDVLDPVWTPAVVKPVTLGVSPQELWKALRALSGSSAAMVQVCGLDVQNESALSGHGGMQTALMAAELARDACLSLWKQSN